MTKITQLDALTTQAAGDLIVIVDDVGGSPETKKITITNLFQGIPVDVGIGVATPSFSEGGGLHIGDAVAPVLRLQDTNTANSDWEIKVPAAANRLDFYHVNSATIQMSLLSGGNFGIGTEVPAGTLHVKQESGIGAIEVLTLQQQDLDEPFYKVIGAAQAANLTRNIVDEGDQASETRQGWIKVEVRDDGNQIADQDYFIPIYTLAA